MCSLEIDLGSIQGNQIGKQNHQQLLGDLCSAEMTTMTSEWGIWGQDSSLQQTPRPRYWALLGFVGAPGGPWVILHILREKNHEKDIPSGKLT